MSTVKATLLFWQGEEPVRTNRTYDINSYSKFKDFCGDRQSAEYGVWRIESGNKKQKGSIYVGVHVRFIDSSYVRQLVEISESNGKLLKMLP